MVKIETLKYSSIMKKTDYYSKNTSAVYKSPNVSIWIYYGNSKVYSASEVSLYMMLWEIAV